MTNHQEAFDVLIVGQGASGYAAALYAARYQMRPVVFGAIFGGETQRAASSKTTRATPRSTAST